MKRFVLPVAILLFAVGLAYAAFTYPEANWHWNSTRLLERNGDLSNWAAEVEDYLDGTTAPPGTLANVVVIDANTTLTATDTGQSIFVYGYSTAANCIVTLPTASAGLRYTVNDANSTANADTYIKAGAGDKINDGTAAQYLACKTDSAGQSVTLEAMDAERWMIVAVSGTWVSDDAPD